MTAPHPEEVADLIEHFTGLSEDRYSKALARNIAKPLAEETAAFRSRDLVTRTEAACKYLISTNANRINFRTITGDENVDARTKASQVAHFISKVRRELALVDSIITEMDAQKGILRNAANPRRRMLERLYQLNLQGDVPKGTARRLLEEEKAKEVERRREAKRASRARAKQARGKQPAPV